MKYSEFECPCDVCGSMLKPALEEYYVEYTDAGDEKVFHFACWQTKEEDGGVFLGKSHDGKNIFVHSGELEQS
jgi:hypothetical protein